jgi:broad specificity phosphatase PhoE
VSARTLVLVRHGRTEWNATGRLQGHADVALDDVGRWQARRGAQTLFRRHKASLVVASDLVRAAQTAQAYADAAGAPVVLDARLRERGFGQWEGLTQSELVDGWPEQYAAWRRGEEPVGIGAESKATVAARMVEAVRAYADDLEPEQTLAVVSHGAAISLAVAALLGQDASYWRGIAGLNNVPAQPDDRRCDPRLAARHPQRRARLSARRVELRARRPGRRRGLDFRAEFRLD